jgi:hypothetical protein
MTPSTEFTSGVIAIIDRARVFNPGIGRYEQHFLDESFNFRVKLSNGGMSVFKESARDHEKGSQFVSDETIQKMASTFTPR